jgi:phage baseplate assembly protein W
MDTGAHFALPLRVGASGAMAATAQDSPAEIAYSAQVLLSTRVGERRCEPGYGSGGVLFTPVGTVEVDTAALAYWEPRATPDVVNIGVATTPPQP